MTAGKTANNQKPVKGPRPMTQPVEAVGGEATSVDPVADAMKQLQEAWDNSTPLEQDEPQEEEPVEGEPVEGEAEGADDEPEIEEEVDDLPPIEAPVSWDAEAKETFKNLPREAQEIVAKREAEREKFVQSKSQEAARAKQDAISQAKAELAEINAQFAQQYQQFAASFTAEEPDPMLQVTDPVAYAQQMRAFRQANAQRTQAQQAAQYHAQQAQLQAMQAQQAEEAEQHRIIVEKFPEYADPTTGPEWRRKLSAIAKDVLGYPEELISQARAADVIAVRNVYDLKVKADKYDALQSKKMEKVRAAKGLPKVATPGVSQGTEQLRARTAQAALDTALTSKNRDVQGEAFYQFLQKSGHIK